MFSPFQLVLLNLIYLQDLLSSRRFLVDWCLCFSFSTSGYGVRLVTADSSSLTCSGSRIIPLPFGSNRLYWPFQLSLVALPTLGADFFQHHPLILDVPNQRVFCPASPGSPEISLSSSTPSATFCLCATLLSLAVDASDSQVGSILQQLLDGSWAPLAFFAKKLSVAEQKHSAFDREVLTALHTLLFGTSVSS